MTVDWRTAPAGTKFRAGIGIATVLPDFDFETYSEAGHVWNPWLHKWESLPGLGDQNRGLPHVGTRNYVQHSSFRILSLSWNLKDGKGVRWWRPMSDETLEDLFPEQRARDYTMPWASGELCDYIASGGLIEAWNVNFEWVVWQYYCVPVLGWPELKQSQCRDAMAKARVSAYPGKMDNAGPVLKLEERKDPAGEKLVQKLTRPKKPSKKNEELRWTPLTAKEDFRKFYEYNRQDIRTESNASVRIPDLSDRELPIWLFDLRCNMRGMQIDQRSVEDCIAIIEQAEAKYNGELCSITNGAAKGSSEVAKMLEWMRHRGVTLYNLDEDTVEEALKRTDYPRDVLRVLEIRKAMAFGSVKKYYAIRWQTTPDGRLYDQYTYAGAHTLLWNGRAVQPANLYKGIFDKPEQVERALQLIRSRCLELLEYEFHPHDALEIIASCLRSMIVAKPGYKLISADFTAIQAVATSCMANEPWRIEVFRTHGKIYEAFASQLTGNPVQFYLDYREQHKKHHPDRQVKGKIPVLATDFGAWIGGWKRFDADKFIGDDGQIKAAILRAWAANPNVVKLWGGQTINKFDKAPDGSFAPATEHRFGLEGAAVSAIQQPGVCFNSRPGSRLGVLYEVFEDVLYCRPPSGGFIRYHAPRIEKSTRQWGYAWEFEMSYEGWNSNTQKAKPGWIRMPLYGGVQTQNVISHMCREIQADALVALDTAQPREYPIVMHTHDEQVAEVPDRPEYNAQEYTEIVRRSLPAWAVCEDGHPWPIKVPLAWEAYRYGKWED